MSVNYAKSTKTRKKYLIVSENNSSIDILFIPQKTIHAAKTFLM